MRRFFGIIIALIGLLFFLDGVTVAAGIGWGGEVDLDSGGKFQVGAAFGLFGLVLAATGWALAKRRR
jgi:hypothetical protein